MLMQSISEENSSNKPRKFNGVFTARAFLYKHDLIVFLIKASVGAKPRERCSLYSEA